MSSHDEPATDGQREESADRRRPLLELDKRRSRKLRLSLLVNAKNRDSFTSDPAARHTQTRPHEMQYLFQESLREPIYFIADLIVSSLDTLLEGSVYSSMSLSAAAAVASCNNELKQASMDEEGHKLNPTLSGSWRPDSAGRCRHARIQQSHAYNDISMQSEERKFLFCSLGSL
jgi:hypothetical protein